MENSRLYVKQQEIKDFHSQPLMRRRIRKAVNHKKTRKDVTMLVCVLIAYAVAIYYTLF